MTRPTIEYANQVAEYRQEFLDAGDSMDGCGSLRRFENPEEYIQVCKDYEDPKKISSHLVSAIEKGLHGEIRASLACYYI